LNCPQGLFIKSPPRGKAVLANIALDRFVGGVPLVGDAFDVMWRSNRRNVQLLREWLDHERWR